MSRDGAVRTGDDDHPHPGFGTAEPVSARPSARGGDIEVVKFGGSSFASIEAYQLVADYVATCVARGQRLCLVVSAMSGTTGRLKELLSGVAPCAAGEDVDAVLGTGEILAAALVRAALRERGVRAASLNAFQLGWTATDDFTAGVLTDFRGNAIRAAFETSEVVVVSGGQAVTRMGRLVMLGRNSSDLTAVAAAAALGRPTATIFSDVEGVCTADPYRLSNTRMIERLDYASAWNYSRAGAKILFESCVSFAEDHGVKIICASMKEHGRVAFGTEIGSVGLGLQVCMPDHYVLVRAGTTVRLDELLTMDGMLPVVGEPSLVASRRDNPAYADVVHLVEDSSDTVRPVVSFGPTGLMQVHAAPSEHVERFAQAIHDTMVEQTQLQRRPERSVKARGTHSGIFSAVVDRASP